MSFKPNDLVRLKDKNSYERRSNLIYIILDVTENFIIFSGMNKSGQYSTKYPMCTDSEEFKRVYEKCPQTKKVIVGICSDDTKIIADSVNELNSIAAESNKKIVGYTETEIEYVKEKSETAEESPQEPTTPEPETAEPAERLYIRPQQPMYTLDDDTLDFDD